MKLRPRLLLCVGITSVCLVAMLPVLTANLLQRSYTDLERQETERNVQRANEALDLLSDTLQVKIVDWAEWDDTYQFMADHNEAYRKSNLVPASLNSMKVDLMMYLDTQGRLFEAVPVKRLPGVAPPSPEAVHRELLPVLRAAEAKKQAHTVVQGLLSTPAFPLIVAARPILTSSGKGPARGWLVSGRYLHPGKVAELASRTRLKLDAFLTGDPRTPQICQQGRSDSTGAAIVSVQPINAQTIAGWMQIYDIHHRPLFTLYIQEPRSLFQQGQQVIRYLVGLLVVAALVFSIVFVLILERIFLKRVACLSDQVERIGENVSSYTPLSLSGSDELTFLVNKMNRMLETIAENTRRLQENKAQLRAYTENLEEMVEARTQQIEHQALHDPLTGLSNRVLFWDRLELARARAQRSGKGMAVLCLNLDNFKLINDSLGHEAGDRMLISVAMRLQECIPAEHTIARMGSDEFAILLEDITGEAAAIAVAKIILQGIQTSVKLDQGQMLLSASLGIACSPDASETSNTLMHNADLALHSAKTNGKNGFVCFDTDMQDQTLVRLELESGVRFALEHNQLHPYYQPIVDLATGRVSGVEVLVRWLHPEKGIISPGKFIPLAEETGLIIPLGFWVLEAACRQMKVWQQTHPEEARFTISVNLSGMQLACADVVERVMEILHQTKLNPKCLKLEITETVLMDNIEATIAKLHNLKALGVKLAIDDFGTGYSSMASLANFPVDTVKIDRAFVSRMCEQEESSAVVAAIIMVAKTLNMDVTAEGIEEEEQVSLLQSLGCHTGQGYFFSCPVNHSDFLENIITKENNFVPVPVDMDREMIEQLLNNFSPADIKRAA